MAFQVMQIKLQENRWANLLWQAAHYDRRICRAEMHHAYNHSGNLPMENLPCNAAATGKTHTRGMTIGNVIYSLLESAYPVEQCLRHGHGCVSLRFIREQYFFNQKIFLKFV